MYPDNCDNEVSVQDGDEKNGDAVTCLTTVC